MAALLNSTPVLAVTDYDRSRDFYRDVLGFSLGEEGGDPPRFGIFNRGRASVFLDAWREMKSPQICWAIYFHVDDLDAMHTEYAASGAKPGEIGEMSYGMREFEVVDPDGHVLCFGQDMPVTGKETAI